MERAVLTLATGKPVYIEMAVNLARSFQWWHRHSAIQFVLATDRKDLLPADLQGIQVVELEPGQLGNGFSPKLHLDQLTPARQTLFLDADCLCYGPLEPVFDRFAGHAVSVIGELLTEGEFFGEVAALRQQFQIAALPRFVGGLYYLEAGDTSRQVYETARALEPRYDEIGLVRLRNHANEEPLIAIAMALHGQSPLPDDGSLKAERMSYAHTMQSELLRGLAHLWNPGFPHPFPTWVQLTEARPRVVHFNGDYIRQEPYLSEALRLQKVRAEGWPVWAASAYGFAACALPKRTVYHAKDLLRPAFRAVFGTRRVAAGVR